MKGKLLLFVGVILILVVSVGAQSGPADTDNDGCVDIGEIVAYVELWKNAQVTIQQVVAGVEAWQQGCGGSDANWYVDKYASGTNSGTSWMNAWQSFADIGWSSLQPGDTVYISGGTDSTIYYEEMYVLDIQGTAANPITITKGIDAEHNGRVIIDAQYPARLTCISVNDNYGPSVDYVTLKGFECRNGRSGIYIKDYATNIIVDSMIITDWYDLAAVFANGVVTANSLPNGIDSITIRNSTMISFVNDGDQTDGVYIVGATNTVIHDNFIWIRNQHPTAHVDGIQSQDTDGFVIYNNVIINDAVYSPEGGGVFLLYFVLLMMNQLSFTITSFIWVVFGWMVRIGEMF